MSIKTRLVRGKYDKENKTSLREHCKLLTKGREDLTGLNKQIQQQLDLSPNMVHKIVARAVGAITPDWLYEKLPMPVARYIAEEQDMLEYLESELKQNIRTIQNGLKELASRAIEKKENLEKLKEDITIARTEKWSALDFLNYLAQETDIKLDEYVQKLLTDEHAVISEEEKEDRAKEFLKQLEANVVIGNDVMEMLSKVCIAGLQIFHAALGQYYNYTRVYRDIAAIRDAAQDMTNTNRSMEDAQQALKLTLEKSLVAIGLAVDAASIAERYSITSKEMQGRFLEGKNTIQKKLEDLFSERKEQAPRLLDIGKVVKEDKIYQSSEFQIK